MASKDMTIIYGGIILPDGLRYRQINDENETNHITLGGTRFTDFKNILRSWRISWQLITEEDFEIINQLYIDQYRNNTYEIFRYDAFGINVPAKLEIANINWKHNGGFVEDFFITILEQFAFS